MILYFSSTGNGKYAAERIAAGTGDRVVSLGDAYKSGDFDLSLDPGESLGLILPTYFGVLPSVVADFLEKAELRLTDSNYVYTVDTYGFHYGGAGEDPTPQNGQGAGRGLPSPVRGQLGAESRPHR